MRRKGLRELKTFMNLSGKQRMRTCHGAYLELASLALHRERLLRESGAFEQRNADIAYRVRDLDRQAALLHTYLEKPDPALLAACRRIGEGAAPAKAPPAAETAVLQEKALKY